MSNTQQSAGVGLPGLLFLLFLFLRLTDQVDWAWYWVAAPLWLPVLVVFVGCLIGGFVAAAREK